MAGEKKVEERDARIVDKSIGLALAHLERILHAGAGSIITRLIQGATDALTGSGNHNPWLNMLESMLSELGRTDDLAHLVAARKALA